MKGKYSIFYLIGIRFGTDANIRTKMGNFQTSCQST